VFVSSRKPITI